MPISLCEEKKLWKAGFKFVAGLDEVGCGPLAGPLVAAAVILPLNHPLPGIGDSKKLTARQREFFFLQVKGIALAIGIGVVSPRQIDALNIRRANILAMEKAVENLIIKPDFLLLDGARFRIGVTIPQKGIKGGDARCVSIAAASIIAKVTRDRLMEKFHLKYPRYNFRQHKGYGTRQHLLRLAEHGPCPIHRRTFAHVT